MQFSECEGFWHIRAKYANNLRTKNSLLNATKSDGNSDYNKDVMSNFVVFASRTDDTCAAGTKISSDVPTDVLRCVPAVTYESNDYEKLTEEELLQAFEWLHTRWTKLTKVNEKFSNQVV